MTLYNNKLNARHPIPSIFKSLKIEQEYLDNLYLNNFRENKCFIEQLLSKALLVYFYLNTFGLTLNIDSLVSLPMKFWEHSP